MPLKLSSSPSKRINKHLLFDSIKPILSPKDIISKNRKLKRSSTLIQLYNPLGSNKYHKYNTNFYNNKENSLQSAKIYLKLEKSEEIAKIVNEEEKKRYFNREFHLNKNLNRDELKRRIENITPSYQRTYNKKDKKRAKIKSVSVRRRKDRLHSSSFNNYGLK